MGKYKLSIDIGGTFIDVVRFDFENKKLRAFKLPTTPHDPAEGVISAISQLDVPADQVFEFIHGTTLGLNAILERKGTTVGIITNEGFCDIFEIARGALEFKDMYNFAHERPRQLVERRNIRGVPGRMDYLGNEVTPLDKEAVVEAARELFEEGDCKAIAVSFLHSYSNTAHEDEAVRLIKEAFPDCEVSSGARLANEYREYERTSTAVMDAYIKPVLKNYLGRVSSGMESQGFRGKKYVMNSSGGALTFGLAEAEPIATVLSGPAGGVSGALYVAKATERPNLISVDVGALRWMPALWSMAIPSMCSRHGSTNSRSCNPSLICARWVRGAVQSRMWTTRCCGSGRNRRVPCRGRPLTGAGGRMRP